MQFSPIVRVKLTSNGKWWQAWWRLPGRQKERRGLGAKDIVSREMALLQCADLELQLNAAYAQAAPRRRGDGPALSAWLRQYADARAADLAAGTKANDRLASQLLREHFADDPPIVNITPTSARGFRTWLLERGGPPADELLRAKRINTVAKHIRRAKVIFQLAVDDKLLESNPFASVPSAGVEIDLPKRTLQDAEIEQLLAATGDRRWRALIALCYFAGLRRHEALALQWSDVRWDKRRLNVQARGTITTKRVSRTVLMEPRLEALLLEIREHTGHGATICALERSHNCATAQLAKIAQAAKLDSWQLTYQLMRSSREAHWMEQHPASVVTSWMGHSPQVAARYYRRVPESAYEPRVKISASPESADKDRTIRDLRARLESLESEIRDNSSRQATRTPIQDTRRGTEQGAEA